MFDYLHFIHPTWRMTKKQTEEITDQLLSKISIFIAKGTLIHIEPDAPKADMATEIDNMGSRLRSPSTESKEEVIHGFTRQVIDRDYHYLFQKLGRPRPLQDPEKESSYTDRWMSHFKYFILDSHPTGVPEFDQLFTDCLEFWQKASAENPAWKVPLYSDEVLLGLNAGKALSYIAHRWEEKHPGQKYFPEN